MPLRDESDRGRLVGLEAEQGDERSVGRPGRGERGTEQGLGVRSVAVGERACLLYTSDAADEL